MTLLPEKGARSFQPRGLRFSEALLCSALVAIQLLGYAFVGNPLNLVKAINNVLPETSGELRTVPGISERTRPLVTDEWCLDATLTGILNEQSIVIGSYVSALLVIASKSRSCSECCSLDGKWSNTNCCHCTATSVEVPGYS